MIIFTHLAIAIRIKHTIEELLPVKLKTFPFLYGNIKPDISPDFDNIPHFRTASNDFLIKEIQNLYETDTSILTENSKDLSERLGILSHYLTDFFCYAHSEKFEGGRLKHCLYEVKLSRYCSKQFRKLNNLPYSKSLPVINDFSDMCFFIDNLHNKYSERKPSLSDDFRFSQEACFALCFSFLYSCTTINNNTGIEAGEVFA